MFAKEKNNGSLKTRVYIARIPKSGKISTVYPPQRNDEIMAVSNENLKREKYYAWRLLECALKDCMGIKISDAELNKNENGRWISPYFELSISHSGGAAAVAISSVGSPVGVDIELLQEPRRAQRMAEWLLSEEELNRYNSSSSPEEGMKLLIGVWTVKEAIFKAQDSYAFKPSQLDISDFCGRLHRETLTLGEQVYQLAVASCINQEISSPIILNLD